MFAVYTRRPPMFGKFELLKTFPTEKSCLAFLLGEMEKGDCLCDAVIRHCGVDNPAKGWVKGRLADLVLS